MTRPMALAAFLMAALAWWWLTPVQPLKVDRYPPAPSPALKKSQPVVPRDRGTEEASDSQVETDRVEVLEKRGAEKQEDQQTESDSHQPPPGAVPYERVGEWMVAYGDVLLGRPTRSDVDPSGFAVAPKLKLWESAVVPYSIDSSLTQPDRVQRVISYFNQNTPVRFVPRTGQADSLVFMPMDGLCVSYLGKIGGHQPILLDDRCTDREIAHELMHALGFIHEHSRADRDQYVSVLWDNIEPDRQSQFVIAPPALTEPLRDRPFDFHSVMLYPENSFARDRGRPTLQGRNGNRIEPVRTGLSSEDLERLYLIYGRR